MLQDKPQTSKRKVAEFFSAKRLAKLGIFSAVAVALYFINVPIAFLFPSFLELNLSDLPILIGGFSLGPLSGAIIALIRYLIKLPFSGTMTVGELSDLINSLAFVLPASIIYYGNKTKKRAIIGIIVGALCSVGVALFSNRFVVVPFYLELFFNGNLDILVGVCKIIPGITNANFYAYYILFAALPFNALRVVIVGIVTIIVYKRISNLLNKI
jgi:riboflavin transporter FmnP